MCWTLQARGEFYQVHRSQETFLERVSLYFYCFLFFIHHFSLSKRAVSALNDQGIFVG
jgi:hypothetical protein